MVEQTMDVSGWLRKQLEQASPDLLRAMVQEMAEALMGAEADALCGAAYGERSPERVNRRNGYRERDWDKLPAFCDTLRDLGGVLFAAARGRAIHRDAAAYGALRSRTQG